MQGIPPTLLTELNVLLVGETIAEVLVVDRVTLHQGEAKVRLVLSINESVRLDWRVRVSLIGVLTLHLNA